MTPATAEKAAGRRAAPGRDKILDTAERLFAEHGFDAVSTKQLALAAGLTIGALYHHFDSKAAIYKAALRAALAKLPAAPAALLAAGGDPEAELQRLIAWFSASIAADTVAAALLRREFLDPHLDASAAEVDVFRAPLARYHVLMAELAPQADADLAQAAIISLSFGLTNLRGLGMAPPSLAPILADPDRIARAITELVLRGIQR